MVQQHLMRKVCFGGLYTAAFAAGAAKGYSIATGIDLSPLEDAALSYAPVGVGIVGGAAAMHIAEREGGSFATGVKKFTSLLGGAVGGGGAFVAQGLGGVCGYLVGKY